MSLKKLIKKRLPVFILEEPGFLKGFDKKKLRSLKNKWKGQRCFIIGNGPSLNKLDLSFLKNEYTFGVNGIFYKTDELKEFKPYFYVVEDSAVMQDNKDRINQYDCNYKFFPNIYKRFINNHKNVCYFNMNRGYYEKKSDYYETPRFSPNPSNRLFCGQSVTLINLQLAYYFGFTEVYLIGMDFKYEVHDSAIINGDKIISQEDDVNHFHPDYFGKGKTWHDPKLDNVLKSYQLAKLIYEHDGRRIINATAGGKLDLFERIDYNSIFTVK